MNGPRDLTSSMNACRETNREGGESVSKWKRMKDISCVQTRALVSAEEEEAKLNLLRLLLKRNGAAQYKPEVMPIIGWVQLLKM